LDEAMQELGFKAITGDISTIPRRNGKKYSEIEVPLPFMASSRHSLAHCPA